MDNSVRKPISHAMIFAGGSAADRRHAADSVLKAHFEGDGDAVRKIESGIFEDLFILSSREPKAEIKVDQIELLIEFLAQKPFASTGRAAVIEGADRMNTFAQNKILKQLEEPAPGVLLLLLTGAPALLLPTVRSRCTFEWLGNTEPEMTAPEAAEDVRELTRLLLFGKGVLPDAWALCAGYERDQSGTLAFLEMLSRFLRDLAAGSLDEALIPSGSLATPEASARIGEKYRRICIRCMPHLNRAAFRTECGDSCKTALREMALAMKTEARGL